MTANHSVVMNASQFLPGGDEPDSQVQITETPTGHAFITISVPNGQSLRSLSIRIEPDEWARYRLSL